MKHEEFTKLVENRLKICKEILKTKNKEYSRKEDKLSNFKQAAALDSCTPEQALWGMWMKHIISIRDIIKDIEREGILPKQSILEEKVVDNINYTLLFEALIEERRKSSILVTTSNPPFDETPLIGISFPVPFGRENFSTERKTNDSF